MTTQDISQQAFYRDGNSVFDKIHVLEEIVYDFTKSSTISINTVGIITATSFTGDGSQLTGIDSTSIKDSDGTVKIQGSSTGATHSGRSVFNEIELNGKLYDGDGDFGTSGQVLASDGTDTNWVNTGSLTAGAASEVGVTAVNDNATHFLTFVDTSSGNENIKVDTDLTYNPSSNTLGQINIAALVVTGNLTVSGQLKDGDGSFGSSGQVLSSDGTDTAWINAGSLTAGAAAEVGVTAVNDNSTHFLTFVDTSSGNENIKVDTNLTYNPSTNVLTAATLSGTATQAANLSNHDTGDLSEGSNQYFTTARARTSISASGDLSYNNSTGVISFTATANTQLSDEQVQDIVGAMVSSNTESGIAVTYQDGDGTIDFSVTSQTDNNFTTTLKNKLDGIASGATAVTNNNQLTNGAGYLTSAGSNVQIFTSSGTWSKPSSGNYVNVYIWGGGGGGGNNSNLSCGGGGGGYGHFTFKMSDLPSTVSVTVGGGGGTQSAGGLSSFAYGNAQAGGGNGGTGSNNVYSNAPSGGNGGGVFGTGQGAGGGGSYTTSTDDGSTNYNHRAASSGQYGIGGGGGAGNFRSSAAPTPGGSSILGGGGGAGYRLYTNYGSGGTSYGGGSGGTSGNAGSIPGGGGSGRSGSGARGEVRVVVV